MKTALKHTLALSAMAIAAQAAAQVTFYEREGFQGESFTTRRQIGNFERFGFNDRASSAVVAGENWEVCEEVRFNGRCVVLRPGQYPSLRSMGLNNRISSVHAVTAEEAVAPPVAALPAPGAGRVVFYEREGLSGRSFSAQSEVADFSQTGFNDRVSSIEVVGGSWEVCQGSGYVGPCAVLRPGQYPSLASFGFDNKISSVRAVGSREPVAAPASSQARVVFYEKEGFAGRSFVAQGEVSDFSRSGFNDRASSVEVLGGRFEVCQDSGFNGPCAVLRPGKYPSLHSMGFNNSISSVRAVGRNARAEENRNTPTTLLYDPRRRDNEQLYEANVTAVRAVVGTPEQRCWVERDQVVQERGRSSNIPAAIAGAVIGGILGHQVGDGKGRDLATVGGAIAGGALGASVGRDGRPTQQAQSQEVQRCTTVPSQASPELWDVTYTFRGQEHRVQMTSPPGSTITVNRDGEPRV